LSASSSPSRALVTTLKLKAESTPTTSDPTTVARVTCSALVSVEASSEVLASRPPKSAPAAKVNPAPVAAPALA
jgi:hypothetical protein